MEVKGNKCKLDCLVYWNRFLERLKTRKMTERDSSFLQDPFDVLRSELLSKKPDDEIPYFQIYQQISEALKSQRLEMLAEVNITPLRRCYRRTDHVNVKNEGAKTNDFKNLVGSKMEEQNDLKDKVKRSLNGCLLQNNGCVPEGKNLRSLKRARRSISVNSPDPDYDSFDDVVPLQNLRLSDSDDELEEFFHKFSMEQKLADFELCEIGSSAIDEKACPERDISRGSSTNYDSDKQLSHMSVDVDESNLLYSSGSKTLLSSTPSIRRESSDRSIFYDAVQSISPISESTNERGIILSLQENLEESIRLEAKSLSIMFQHEARHAESGDENTSDDYEDFLTSKSSEVPSDLLSCSDSAEEEEEINNYEGLLVNEKQILKNSFEQIVPISCQDNSNQHFKSMQDQMMSPEEVKEKSHFSFTPLLPAIMTESTGNSFWKLKPKIWQSPLKRPVKAVVPLSEMVRSAKKDEVKGGNSTGQSLSGSVLEVKNSLSGRKEEKKEFLIESTSNMIREPLAGGMLILSLPYSVPRKKKFEQLLCPSLSRCIVKTE